MYSLGHCPPKTKSIYSETLFQNRYFLFRAPPTSLAWVRESRRVHCSFSAHRELNATVLQRLFVVLMIKDMLSLASKTNDNMKKSSLYIGLIGLLPMIVCQCSPSYRLVDYKEYCGKDLDTHTTYQYENGLLNSKTEVFTRGIDIVDSIVTYYDVIINDNSIDSIEISYDYRNGVLDEAIKVVKTCNPEGVIQKQTEFEYQDDDWLEEGFTLYDSKGRWIEYVRPGQYHSWSTYDSLDRQIGIRYMHIFSNNDPIFIDTVEFASDGLTATQTHYTIFQDDKRHVNSKKSYRLDDKGRVILQEILDTDQDSIQHKVLSWNVYRYDRKGRIKTETQFSSFDSNPNKMYRSYKHKYRFGLKTRTIEYAYSDGHKILYTFTVFKYDFRHRLLLEKTDYDDRLRRDFDERKVWTYEKVQ